MYAVDDDSPIFIGDEKPILTEKISEQEEKRLEELRVDKEIDELWSKTWNKTSDIAEEMKDHDVKGLTTNDLPISAITAGPDDVDAYIQSEKKDGVQFLPSELKENPHQSCIKGLRFYVPIINLPPLDLTPEEIQIDPSEAPDPKISADLTNNRVVQVSKKTFEEIYRRIKPKPKRHQKNGLFGGVKFVNTSAKEALEALTKRSGAAQFDADINVVIKAKSTVQAWLKELITPAVIEDVSRRLKIKDYIERQPDTNKKKSLYKVQELHNKYGFTIKDLILSSECFQKDSIAEPKYANDVMKPRIINSTVVHVKNKSLGLSNNASKKVKQGYKPFYNLYANYIAALFTECIKEGQKRNVYSQPNKPTFVHGQNSESLLSLFQNSINEMPDGKLVHISTDFAKFDAHRSQRILENFDNPIILWFIDQIEEVLRMNGYDDNTLNVTKKFITQTVLDVTYKDSKGRPTFSCRLHGTVPSGFGPRTTLGNTLYNIGYQLLLTENIPARSFAGGDDGATTIHMTNLAEVRQRIGKLTKRTPEPGDHGLGLLIDTEPTYDTDLICFLSKIIDLEYNSCVRMLERVAATGCVTSSKIPIEEVNYLVNLQISEYLNTFGYKSLKEKRSK